MSFVVFFRGMLAVLFVFATTIYFLTGSAWTAFWQTIACAVLIQVGYFLGVLFMIWRSEKRASRGLMARDAEPLKRSDDGAVDSRGKLPVAPYTRRP